MAKKSTPLKDEQLYTIDNLYNKFDELQKAVNNRNLEEAKKLWNWSDSDLAKYVLNLVDFNKSVATAMDAYLKKNHDKVVVEEGRASPKRSSRC